MTSEKKRILVVDDEIEIREILKDLIEDLGEVVCVENGTVAVRKLKEASFDLVVTDYDMPALNGLQLLKTINELGVKAPVIWITGRSNKDLVLDAWREGVFDYIEKPFKLDQVRKSVITALSMQTAQAVSSGNFFNRSEFVEVKVELRSELEARAKNEAARRGMTVSGYLAELIRRDLKG